MTHLKSEKHKNICKIRWITQKEMDYADLFNIVFGSCGHKCLNKIFQYILGLKELACNF